MTFPVKGGREGPGVKNRAPFSFVILYIFEVSL